MRLEAPMCCAGCQPPPCCQPACQMPLEKLRPAKRHYCCTADSQCELCSKYPKKLLCSNYMRNKYIVDSLSCLFRITHFQVLSSLFRLACDELKPQWHYPRDRVWSVMENVKSPYTEQLDLAIYDSLHDRCGQPIDPLDQSNTYKVLRLLFMIGVLVPEQHDSFLAMLHRLKSRSICPVNLEGLLLILGRLTLFQLVLDILEQDKRLRRFPSAREFWELSHQEVSPQEDSAVIPKRRRKKVVKVKNTYEEKKPMTRKPPPIYCTLRAPPEPQGTVEAAGRPEDMPPSRRSSVTSRRSSIQRSAAATTPARWISGSATRTGQLLPHSIPILGLRSLYFTW